ncbi:MAG: 2OG-Fe(II) oxygenase [Emcibacter sp.]|nr:2OG-Fe(II) oxygenase [Emcibacter sp.]
MKCGKTAPDGEHEGVCEDKTNLLFETIAQNITDKGYSLNINCLPIDLHKILSDHLHDIHQFNFKKAGIGRNLDHIVDHSVRRDEICWITGNTIMGKAWLDWISSLQIFLNRQLFMGLFSFESHFAHYQKDAYYKKHYDAFKGEANRILSVVLYLNPNWCKEDAGELVLYFGEDQQERLIIAPEFATLVVFLSEDFSHEVLSSNNDRYSIAGWFRLKPPLSNDITIVLHSAKS